VEKAMGQSRVWHLFSFLANLHTQIAFGSAVCSDEKDRFMMTTFMVPTAAIEENPRKYLEIPEIKEVPRASLKVTYKKYKRISTTKTTATNITAEVHNSKIEPITQKVTFLPPSVVGTGGKVQMKLPFYVSAEYVVDNHLPKQEYTCQKKKEGDHL
jgi:hypothetical protein